MKEKPGAAGEICAEDVARLARLTRLQISPAEAEDAARAISDILQMMRRLQDADAAAEDDASCAPFWGESLRLRDDVARAGYDAETLLRAAPRAADGCFIVPKVIE